MKEKLYGLDLFSGIGGIGKALDEWVEVAAYCERDPYAQGVLLSRMASNDIDNAPIWDDVSSLTGAMLPKIDIVFGGFPCQDISCAGLGKGLGGERSGLFFQIVRLVGEIRPSFIFLENVPAIRSRGADVVCKELASLGYDLRWTTLSAAEVGANHKRERWFLLARRWPNVDDAEGGELRDDGADKRTSTGSFDASSSASPSLAHAPWHGRGEIRTRESAASSEVGHAASKRLSNRTNETIQKQESHQEPQRSNWWSIEPDVGGTLDGLSSWLDGFDMTESHKLLLTYGKANNQNINEILPALQSSIQSSDDWKSPGGSGCIPSSEILLAYLRQLSKASEALVNISLASEKTQEELLRGLRLGKKSPRSPLRWEAIKQRKEKYPNTLYLLSQVLAFHAEKAWSTYKGENPSIVRYWESGIARIASGASNRVDRLKCLGNAVVPLQEKTAFKELMGIE